MKKIARKIIRKLSFLTSQKSIIVRCVASGISNTNGYVYFYDDKKRLKVLDLIHKIKDEDEEKMCLCNNEAYQIYMAVERTKKVDGDIAEVGCYKGGSAKLICEVKGDKSLHVFDTFEGLPNPTDNDNTDIHHKGQYAASLEYVEDYLKYYNNVYLYKGLFPSTSEPIKDKKFSFVHLDVDLYEATKASIEFFYPRMNKGGIMISHDYIDTPGVRKAFDDFFGDKPEPIIEMSGSQCLVVKV